jgi:hypothetical protein
MGGWSCGTCYQDCWRSFSAISAVPGVSVYTYVGTFFNQDSALANANKDSGTVLGPCYYTNGGKSLRSSLLDPQGFLIAGVILLGFAGLTFAFWVAAICRNNAGVAAKRKALFQGGAGLLESCLTRCCRRRSYSAIGSQSPARHHLDVL